MGVSRLPERNVAITLKKDVKMYPSNIATRFHIKLKRWNALQVLAVLEAQALEVSEARPLEVSEAQALEVSEAQALEVSEARALEVSEAQAPVMSTKCHVTFILIVCFNIIY